MASIKVKGLILNATLVYTRLERILTPSDMREATNRAVVSYGAKTIAQRTHSLLFEAKYSGLMRATVIIFGIAGANSEVRRQLVGMKTHITLVESVWGRLRREQNPLKIPAGVIGPVQCLNMLFL